MEQLSFWGTDLLTHTHTHVQLGVYLCFEVMMLAVGLFFSIQCSVTEDLKNLYPIIVIISNGVVSFTASQVRQRGRQRLLGQGRGAAPGGGGEQRRSDGRRSGARKTAIGSRYVLPIEQHAISEKYVNVFVVLCIDAHETR